MDFRHAGFATAAIVLLLTGCATGPSTWATDPGLPLAVITSSAYDPARTNFSNAIILGTVKGASSSLLSNSGEQFRDGLKASLYMNYLLATNAADARYRVDLEVNFTGSGVLDRQVDTTVHYRLISIASNEIVIDKIIQSTDTQAWSDTSPWAPEHRDPIAGIFAASLGASLGMDASTYARNAHLNSERKNIAMFLDELSRWKPSASMGASSP